MKHQYKSDNRRKADIKTALSCCGVCEHMPRLQMISFAKHVLGAPSVVPDSVLHVSF